MAIAAGSVEIQWATSLPPRNVLPDEKQDETTTRRYSKRASAISSWSRQSLSRRMSRIQRAGDWRYSLHFEASMAARSACFSARSPATSSSS